jgi:hypothetical protein
MSDDLNLDISSYNKDELLGLFNCEEVHSRDHITKLYNEKLRSLQTISNKDLQKQLKIFFNGAFKRLTEVIPHLEINKPITPTQKMHPMPPRVEQSVQPTQRIQYPLGVINPINRKTQSVIFSLDTLFRDIINYPNSNDFIYELPVPIENVINMKLLSAEIPNSQPLYSEKAQNNKFVIKMFNGWTTDYDPNTTPPSDTILTAFPAEGKELTITFPNGSPSFGTLISYINGVLNSQRNSFSFLQAAINPITGLVFFRFKTLTECVSWNITYYFNPALGGQPPAPPDNIPPTSVFKMPTINTTSNRYEHNYLKRIYMGTTAAAAAVPPVVAELPVTPPFPALPPNLEQSDPLSYSVDFNPSKISIKRSLGWSLGFRNKKYDGACQPKASTLITNTTIVPTITYLNTYKYGPIEYLGFYSGNVPYGDAESDYNYIYVNEFTGNYNDTLLASLEKTYLAKSILARLQINTGFYDVQFTDSNQGNTDTILGKQRDYFGPVNIEKLHIKIIDKFGVVSDNINVNYSLTFQFETLYSSIRN